MEQMTLNLPGVNLEEEVIRKTMTLDEKIEESKKILKLAAEMSKEYYGKPLIVTYSGGKDSDAMLHLAEECLNVDDFEVLSSHTSVDAPQTIFHLRKVFKRLNEKGIKAEEIFPKDSDGSHLTMWKLIVKKKMPNTRLARYCCQHLKELTTPNRLVCLGVREDESTGRRGRNVFGVRGKTKKEGLFFSLEHTEEVHREAQEIQDPTWDCTLIKNMREHNDALVNPIYYWTTKDVWDYINREGIETNPLYFEANYTRVGCILCPMSGYKQKLKEIEDFPTYKQAYIHAFDEMLKTYDDEKLRATQNWKTGEDVFNWWIERGKHEIEGQMSMFDEE